VIRINRCTVAEKHQSTGNSYRQHYDIARPEFIFYADSPPFFSTVPAAGQDGVAR
jgi:hypothetical protein